MIMADVTDLNDAGLEKEGWTKRSILDEPRLSEAAETYLALGFEVRLVPVDTDSITGCTTCLEGDIGNYRIIFTKPRNEAGETSEIDFY
jgi:hypothetical protein